MDEASILRIAVISSPRSGNSWIRSVLAGSLGMQEIAVHNYLDIQEQLPDRCFLQIHWYREPNFQTWLAANKFRTLCVARHPLDILLSVMHYIRYEPDTAKWLGGNVDIPSQLLSASPASKAFLDYAIGDGAENLLSISYQWWRDARTHQLRYEDCVADPMGVLGREVELYGGQAENVAPWLQHLSIENMRATPNRHGWQGCAGLYKQLIPTLNAYKIYKRHKRLFDTLGYRIDPYLLGVRKAEQNWSVMI